MYRSRHVEFGVSVELGERRVHEAHVGSGGEVIALLHFRHATKSREIVWDSHVGWVEVVAHAIEMGLYVVGAFAAFVVGVL